MWLTHTRHDPPSIEELQLDITRQRRIQQSALQLEAQYEAERQAHQLLPEPQSNSSVQYQEDLRKSTPVNRPKQRPASEKERMLVPPSAPPAEAQPWSPKTIRRG
ncbi:7822_t:CDS:2 [Acaulospora colombiana]|uniref:7822_t:CDS:1 n=1 Tax=Acaulospora colombiana TaxID=27376 RepID=A0ACA9M1L4_9GLOM|nr:7822_t:CDS:2 [Acaulospora colombiana]